MYVEPQTQSRHADECETDFGISYSADGTFTGYEEAGMWRVEGSDLIETVTETWEMGGSSEAPRKQVGPTRRMRMEWVSDDVVNLIGETNADGYGLVRCLPSAEVHH